MARGQVSSANKSDVVEDYRTGMPVNEIRAKHRVSIDTILHWVDEAGVPRRRRRYNAPNPSKNPRQKDRSPLALKGGAWVPDSRGISHWVEGASA